MMMKKFPLSLSQSLHTIARNSFFGFLIAALLGVSGLITTPSLAAGGISIECMEPPTIKEVRPNVGSPDGGETVDIIGNCFERDATVAFDREEAKVVELSAERITVIVPKHDPAVVDVSVTNPGQRPIVLEKGYTYQDSRLKSVTYSANGGIGTLIDERSPYEVGSSVEVLKPEGIKRDGYNFVNWNTQSNGEGVKYNPGESFRIEENTTLYAIWELIPLAVYTVTFNGTGATSGNMSPQSSSVPAALSSNLYARTGYTFAGWNTVAGGGGTAYANGATYPFTASITLYAQWAPIPSHTVTFIGNGATGGSTDSQTANSPTALRLNGFTRTGYTFDSWNTQANGAGVTYSNGASYDFAADLTLYARWTTLPLHTITFNANGGSGSMSPQSSSVASPINANTFTRSGFNFVGWLSAPSGGTHYDAGAIYPFTADLTLYAEWSAIIVPPVTGGGGGAVITTPVIRTVTFNGNVAASGSMATQSSDKAVPLNKLAFTRPGYNFDHWSTKPDVDGTLFDDEGIFPFYADTTLYAHWSPRVIRQVTFSSNGTAITSVNFQSSANPAALNPNTVIRSGYNFLGWNTASNGSGVAFTNGATYSFDFDLNLFAQWAPIPYEQVTISIANPLVLPLKATDSKILRLLIVNLNGTITPALVQIPVGLVGVDSSVRITPVSTPESELLGLVSLQVEVLDGFGAVIPELLAQLTMQLTNSLGENVVAQSSDGFIWSPLPQLAGTTLAAGQTAGYYLDSDGVIVVVTSHLTQFGLRRAQGSQLVATTPTSAMGLAAKALLSVSGGSGKGAVRFSTATPAICVVSATGIVAATRAGRCDVSAVKGGDAIYLNSGASNLSLIFSAAYDSLALTGTGTKKKLSINLGLTRAGKAVAIQVKALNAKSYKKISTVTLDSAGRSTATITALPGSSIQAVIGRTVVASLKVAG
jgi:uncharacterized repeat protein (TIGR02543 family)